MTTSVHLPFVFPPGVDGPRLLAPIDTAAADASGEYRKIVTRTNPLLFAIVYLPHHLVLRTDRGSVISLSQLHLDVAGSARGWVRRQAQRDAWIAPRGSGKTSWFFLILALWALAHEHRRFFLALAHSSEQAKNQLANLRMELEHNDLLLSDFEHLRPGSRVRGAQDTTRTVLRGGVTVAARGIDSTSLGIKSGADRPDLIVLDDLEPDESNYSAAAKDKRLATVLSAVLPMNESAAVALCGTVTMAGSITDDLVRHVLGEGRAPWVDDAGFVPHYYDVIQVDPVSGRERSLWPEKWPWSWIEHNRNTRSFALNYRNRPASAGGSYWTPGLFVIDDEFPAVDHLMYIDPAVTSGAHSDMTAIVIVGTDPGGRRAVIEHAWAGRLTPTALRSTVHRLARKNHTLRTVWIENNQGGDAWAEVLSPMPDGVRLETDRAVGSKRSRIERALDHYERGAVRHRQTFRDLEDQMLAYPRVTHDDLIDATAGALRKAFQR